MTTPEGYEQYYPAADGTMHDDSVSAFMVRREYGRRGPGSEIFIMALIFTGIFLVMFGKMMLGVIFKVDDNDTEETLLMLSTILSGLGGGLASMGLIWGGLGYTDYSDTIRIGLLIAGGICLGLFICGGLGLWDMMRLF